MKTRRLIAIFITLAIITLIVVLCSVVFTVQSIDCNFLTSRVETVSISNEDIIKSSKIKHGSSVFNLKKDEYIEAIESTYPYIEVNTIEVQFPSKVVIHMSERVPVYYMELSGATTTDYCILDENMKVLELVSDLTKFDPKLVRADISSELVISNFTPGNVVEFKESDMLNTLYRAFLTSGYKVENFRGIIDSVEFDYTQEFDRLDMRVTFSSGNIIMANDVYKGSEKFALAVLSKYEEYLTSDTHGAECRLSMDSSGDIMVEE